jgi:hypothetical protein
MKGSVDLRLTSQAEEDLKHFGRLTRRLLQVVIRDQLVASSGAGLTVVPDPMSSELAEDVEPLPFESDASRWYSMPLTHDYVAIVRPFRDGSDSPGAVVARVIDNGTLESLTGGSVAQASRAEREPAS